MIKESLWKWDSRINLVGCITCPPDSIREINYFNNNYYYCHFLPGYADDFYTGSC